MIRFSVATLTLVGLCFWLVSLFAGFAAQPQETAQEPPVGRTESDRQRNATLLRGYDYSKYPGAITGYNGQDLQRIGFVSWQHAERIRVGPRGSYKAGMTQLPNGKLILAACRDNNEKGARRGFLIDVYDSGDEGRTWEKVNKTRLYGKEPSLTALPDGSVVLTAQDFRPGSTRDKVVISRSLDTGVTWETSYLPGRAYPRNLIVEADGSLLMIRGGKGMDSPHLQLCRSQNGGKTWDISEGIIDWEYQPYSEVASLRHKTGRLIAVLRTLLPGAAVKDAHGFGVGMVTHSIDDGKTWSKPQVITNNAEVHVYLTQLNDGRILATYSNYHLPFGTFAIISTDGGQTWDREHPIQLAVSALNQSGWPVTLQLADNTLITAYALTAYLHQDVKFVTEVVRWKLPERKKPFPRVTLVGPVVGDISADSAILWARPVHQGDYKLVVSSDDPSFLRELSAYADIENDLCVHWQVEGLRSDTTYKYRIECEDRIIASGDDCHFRTAPPPDEPSRVCLALGSCAWNEPLELWRMMNEEGAQGIVLLGDTPYIDSRDLSFARRQHREFWMIPQLAKLGRHTPVWGTWDDHDYGDNGEDGNFPGKHHTRRAFLEYRMNASYGEDGQGVYTKFRYGPLEVFLLDARWFARTEPSEFDPGQPTLLGKQQWKWLRRSLLASTAPFKLLCTGMTWDDKKWDTDDWDSYPAEKKALFDFLGEHDITGAVLVGGDVHCSRHLRYETNQQVGYPLHQFVVSPIHSKTAAILNVPHPNLVHSAVEPNVYLRIVADTTVQPAQLSAEWIQMDGREMWDVKLDETMLRR